MSEANIAVLIILLCLLTAHALWYWLTEYRTQSAAVHRYRLFAVRDELIRDELIRLAAQKKDMGSGMSMLSTPAYQAQVQFDINSAEQFQASARTCIAQLTRYGWTHQAIADAIGVSRDDISDWYFERATADTEAAVKLGILARMRT